ncbi:MAG TPA: hypothetical protein PLP86_05975, partial [Armatimonadota bacterium]|nr:hypothetical protein [Armatimonadota bacterium]
MRFLVLLLLLPVMVSAQTRFGHEPYGPPSPLDVCVSSVSGQIAIAETEKNQVVLLNSDWQVEKVLGSESRIERPVSVDRTPQDELVVLTGGDKPRVVILDRDGQLVNEFSAPKNQPLKDPGGVAVDDNGYIYVFDTGNHRVVVFNRAGSYVFDFSHYLWTREFEGQSEVVTDRLETPIRGDFLPDGRLIIADYDGPVVNPKTGQRGGRYSVWKVDVSAKTATFIEWAFPEVPYETSKAGDVFVDRKTGEIFYAEADSPLTDHSWVKRSAGIGQNTDYGFNFYNCTSLTHPRGVAVGKNGEIIIAEADKGYTFSVPRSVFTKDYNIDWPRRQRIVNATQTSVTIQYDTMEAVPTVLEVAPADDFKHPKMPAGAKKVTGKTYRSDGSLVMASGQDAARGERHRITLTGLQPGKRYAYRFLVTERAYPEMYSQALIAATRPPQGKTQYAATRMIILLFSNIYQPADGVTPPGPMTAEEIEALKQRLEVARMFYWVNSHCKLDLRYDWVIVDKEYDRFPVSRYAYWPEDDHREIDRILAEKGVKHDDTSSVFCIYGHRHWDPQQKKWVLSGSGGNTWGSSHDGSSFTVINAGGDSAWLLIHEHGHGLDIGYFNSGHKFHFNHFHHNYFPERYGSHYDGCVAIARAFSDVEYWSSVYGKLVVVDDRDGDGIPDNDPACPLDEKRFKSDSTKLDTDADGLTDLEELMAYDGVGAYPGFSMRPIAPYYLPDPRNKDTDKDGIPDGQDRYPLYAIDTNIYKLPVSIDGKITAQEYSKGFKRVMSDPDLTGAVQMAYTDDYLVFAVRHKAQDYRLPAMLRIEIDANNDGITVGADNLEIEARP